MSKEIDVFITQATKQGWVVSLTNGGHYKWTTPKGKVFFSAKTPSDIRAIKNLKRDLRVNGFLFITKQERKRL